MPKRALVVYGGRGVSSALQRAAGNHPYVKRARMAYGAYRHFYNNRYRYAKAARTIGRAYRRYKSYRQRAAKSDVPRAKASAQVTPGAVSVLYRQLNMEPIEFFERTSELGERESSTVFLKGLRMCEVFENTGAGPNDTIEMHWAIVQLRSPLAVPEDADLTFGPTWFRDNSSKDDKSFPFTNASGTTSYDFRYNCFGINPDKLNVITHRKKKLLPKSIETNGRWFWKINKYFRINKVITFDKDLDKLPNKPFYVAYWWNYYGANGNGARDPTSAPTVLRLFKHVQVFKTVNA